MVVSQALPPASDTAAAVTGARRPSPRHQPSPLVYALVDALLLACSWIAVYVWRYGSLPSLSAGPMALVVAWLTIHFVLGTYTALARHQLTAGRQLRNCVATAILVFMLAAALTSLRGELFSATMGRRFLVPVLLLAFFASQLLRLSQVTAHLWQPQERWLLIASAQERSILSQAIDFGGCAIPCGVEWRSSDRMPPLPDSLATLLRLDGVAIGSQLDPNPRDRRLMLDWQEEGVRLLSLSGWAETFLQRLPAELVPPGWSERVQQFGHARSGPSQRLKRLADLIVSGLLLALLLPPALLLCRCGLLVLSRDCCSGRHGRPFVRLRFAGTGPHTALPQLLNVWRGEMSLVGPRPFSIDLIDQLEQRFSGAELRQWMRPGMTGWGRIAGAPPQEPDAIAWELARDLYYLRNHSLLLDLRLLLFSLAQVPGQLPRR